jgi:beta-glucosidase
MGRIDDAVRRILTKKIEWGLLEGPYADRSLLSSVGSAEHREIARRAVRQSLVLLKNAGGTLPLSKDLARIHVSGILADDLGSQCGGWTISWQGSRGPITTGTTILEAITDTASATTTITGSLDGTGAEGADAAVVVIGETPYAEYMGDRTDLTLDATQTAMVSRVAQTGVPTIVILISGRPMILGATLDDSDAFLAAWLPGTEGQGIADVLFGDYAPTGQLPHSWPRDMDQIPINWGDADYDPLFAYGFGLTY